MYNLPEEQAAELKRLESIATEKRIAYQKIDHELFADKGSENMDLLPEYTKAKKELTDAVNNYNLYKSKLATTYIV